MRDSCVLLFWCACVCVYTICIHNVEGARGVCHRVLCVLCVACVIAVVACVAVAVVCRIYIYTRSRAHTWSTLLLFM